MFFKLQYFRIVIFLKSNQKLIGIIKPFKQDWGNRIVSLFDDQKYLWGKVQGT